MLGPDVKMSFDRANEIIDDRSHVSHSDVIARCRGSYLMMGTAAIRLGE